MGRKLAREEAMKLIFQMDLNNDYSQDVLEVFLDNNDLQDDEVIYIREAVKMIMDNRETIDETISTYAKSWRLNRIAKVDLAVLRIAIHEIMYRDDIPKEVSINEALEISKKYSSGESSKFINGVLGSFVRELEKDE